MVQADIIPEYLSPGMQADDIVTDVLQTIIWNPLWQVTGFELAENLKKFFLPEVEIQTPTPIPGSPLILDIDGDGVETVGLDSNIHFDHNGDGFAETTGWVGADDALLALDLNGDGIINNGTELFGNETLLANGNKAANGFEAWQP
ncbi:MAG: hypothetical protein HC848_04205 [Limnobacter sp.]|nr:hypothetical protein [Limnobacter sp.]